MPLTPDQLPDDIAELKRLLVARDAELTAAKNGLLVTQLTIEKLKAQVARFRREKFGASSERIERVIAQLELALEEAEAEKAEAAASAPQPPEPPTSSDPQSAETPAPEKKKRRQLPPELPRRDVVHMPADVCKTCGGTELRTVSESVTEVLEYIPGRFEVIRHRRPACSYSGASQPSTMTENENPRRLAAASGSAAANRTIERAANVGRCRMAGLLSGETPPAGGGSGFSVPGPPLRRGGRFSEPPRPSRRTRPPRPGACTRSASRASRRTRGGRWGSS